MQLATSECPPPFRLRLLASVLERGSRALPVLLLLLAGILPSSRAATDVLYIGGHAPTSITAPNGYWFKPWVSATHPSNLTFRLHNAPSWAVFNSKTGAISGRTVAGTYAQISMSVTDGIKTAWMPQWTIVVESSGGQTNPTPTPTPDTPKISGSPATSVVVDSAYSFQPTASDPTGARLTFSISTKPTWATFDTSTGHLSGTPSPSNVGTVYNIVITASNGKASASLPAFSLTVTQLANGSASLSWQPPTQNTNGSPLTNLAGYHIVYGTSPSSLNQTVRITNPGLTSYLISNLSPGTWYFAMSAFTTSGMQSALSATAHTTVN